MSNICKYFGAEVYLVHYSFVFLQISVPNRMFADRTVWQPRLLIFFAGLRESISLLLVQYLGVRREYEYWDLIIIYSRFSVSSAFSSFAAVRGSGFIGLTGRPADSLIRYQAGSCEIDLSRLEINFVRSNLRINGTVMGFEAYNKQWNYELVGIGCPKVCVNNLEFSWQNRNIRFPESLNTIKKLFDIYDNFFVLTVKLPVYIYARNIELSVRKVLSLEEFQVALRKVQTTYFFRIEGVNLFVPGFHAQPLQCR